MQSNERVRICVKNLQSNVCLWEVYFADYKNHSKKWCDFLCENYDTAATDFEKASRASEVSYGESTKK